MTNVAGPDRSIVVSDAGFLPTTRQMALAVSDELSRYYTPYWAGGLGGRLLQVPRLGKELARRSLPPELSSRAQSFQTGTELLRVSLGRLGLHVFDRRLIWRRNIAFDRRVAGMLRPATTLVGQYGVSLASFEQARRLNGRTILDYPIARLDFAYELLAEEGRLRPEFADTIFGPHALTPTAGHLSRMAAEVELADLVVVGSRFAAASFSGIVEPDRLAVVPYGVDTSAFRPSVDGRPRGPLRMLFAGQLTQRKGIAYALEAMELLDPAAFQLTLIGPVIGRGRGLRRHEARFRRLSGVPLQDMPAVYAQADVLVLPSIVEGSAVVVLEAMASGLPVIVTPNVGADAVQDGVEGFVVPIRTPEAIAERLELLSSDPELRLRMGQAARARSETCTWPRFHERVRELVIGLAETGAPIRPMEAVT
jgi:alpha-maltose-1-phosphate synthase